MITPDQDILTTMTMQFTNAAKMGSGLIRLNAESLLYLLCGIDLAWAAICWSLSEDGNIKLEQFIKKIFLYSCFVFMVLNYQAIIDVILESFVTVGLKAGGNTLSFKEITDPSYISKIGLQIVTPILDGTFQEKSAVSTAMDIAFPVNTLLKFAMTGLIALLIMACFFAVGIMIFITYLEFVIIAAIGLILLPFGVWGPTAFIFDKIKNAIISLGIKFMVLSFTASVSIYMTKDWQLPVNSDWHQIMYVLLGAAAITFLNWHVPATASGLATGSGGGGFGAGMVTGAALGAMGSASRGATGFGKALFGDKDATGESTRGLIGKGGVANTLSSLTSSLASAMNMGSKSGNSVTGDSTNVDAPSARPLADGQSVASSSEQTSGNSASQTQIGSDTSSSTVNNGTTANKSEPVTNSPANNGNKTGTTNTASGSSNNTTNGSSNNSGSELSTNGSTEGGSDRGAGTFDTGGGSSTGSSTISSSNDTNFKNQTETSFNSTNTPLPSTVHGTKPLPKTYGNENFTPTISPDRKNDVIAATKTDHTRGINL